MKKKIFKCELCFQTKSKIIQTKIRNAHFGNYMNFNVHICKNCCLIQLYNYSNVLKKKAYYKKYYLPDTYNYNIPPKKYINDQKLRGKNVYKFLKKKNKIIGKIENMDVIDIGCGTGGTFDYFIDRTKSVFGTDPIIQSVRLAKKIGYNVTNGFLEKININNNSVDLILLLGTIEHAYDLDKSLRECKRVLRNKGKIFIRWRSNKLWGSPIEYFNSNHYRYFNSFSINYLAYKHNLKIVLKTDTEIEGKPGAKYFILEKNDNFNSKKPKVRNSYLKIVKNFQQYEKMYFNKAVNFLNNIRHTNYSISSAKRFIKNKKNNYRALNLDKKSMFRAIVEAKSYISYYIS